MKKFILTVIILLIGAAGAFIVFRERQNVTPGSINVDTTSMRIESPAFEHNRNISAKYTCDDKNINPPLTISGVPNDAKSLVLIVDDPDAPMGIWVHWTLWNMDPALTEIAEDSVPEGIEGVTSYDKPGYGGPCPPSGTHRYFFKLYALDVLLSIPETSNKEALEKAMQGHTLASAELVGLYSRK